MRKKYPYDKNIMIGNSGVQNNDNDQIQGINKTRSITHDRFHRSHGTIATTRAYYGLRMIDTLKMVETLYAHHLNLCEYQHTREPN